MRKSDAKPKGRPGRALRGQPGAASRIIEPHARRAGGASRAVAAARGLPSAAACAALMTVPLFFNPRTERVFEPDKLAWLELLGLLAVGAAVSIAVGLGFRRFGAWVASADKPLLAAAALVGLAVLAGSLASTVLDVSLWGTYRRAHGLWAHLALLSIFLAVAVSSGATAGRSRVLRAAMLPAVPAAIYALLQRARIDAIPWDQYGDAADVRAFGPLGNALFLGSYLAPIVPLAAAVAMGAWAERHRTGPAAALAWLACAVLAAAGVVASGSRGPAMAAAFGLAVVGVLWAADTGRARAAVATAGGAGLLLAGLMLAGRAGVPGLERFGDLLAAGSRTVVERTLVWEAMGRLALEDPGRIALGYGPESLAHVLAPFADLELARLTPEQVFDRAHNLLWEWWLSAGIVGMLAVGLLYAAAFAAGVRAMGWRVSGWWPGASGLAAAVAAGVAAAALAPAPALAAPAAVVGGAVGLCAGAAVGRLRRGRGAEGGGDPSRGQDSGSARGAERRIQWWAIGALGAVGAHLVDGALGLPTASGELVFWACLGVLASGAGRADAELGLGLEREAGASRNAPRDPSANVDQTVSAVRASTVRRGSARGSTGLNAWGWDDPIARGLLDGLALCAIMFAPILLPYGPLTALSGRGVLLLLVPLGFWAAAAATVSWVTSGSEAGSSVGAGAGTGRGSGHGRSAAAGGGRGGRGTRERRGAAGSVRGVLRSQGLAMLVAPATCLLLYPFLAAVPGGAAIAFGAALLTAVVAAAVRSATHVPETAAWLPRVAFAAPDSRAATAEQNRVAIGMAGPRALARSLVAVAVLAPLVVAGGWWIALRPVVADARLRSGLEAAASRDLQSARAMFRSASGLWPEQPNYAYYVAAAERDAMLEPDLSNAERDTAYSTARRALEGAMAKAPAEGLARGLGTLLRDRGDAAPTLEARAEAWREAEAWFVEALRLDPHSGPALADRAALFQRTGDAAAAAAGYRAALEVDANRADRHVGLARAELAAADAPAAAAALESARALVGDERLLQFVTASGQAPTGDLPAALDPLHTELLRVQAVVLSGDIEAGLERLAELRRAGAGDAPTRSVEAWLTSRAR